MKRLITLVLLCTLLANNVTAQQDSTKKFAERLLIDIPLIDIAFLQQAGKTSFNKKHSLPSGSKVKPAFADYIGSYENLSMEQAIAVTKDLHSTNYYFQNKLWNKVIEPQTKKKRFYNRVAANITAGAIDYALAYQGMVFSPVWLHEEFHRNGLTLAGIASYNDTYYKLNGKGDAGGSVSKIKDEDLIRFKKIAPVEMVRSFASGIESHYLLLRNMQKDNFFKRTNYPNIVMNILLTKEAVGYVNQFKTKDYDSGIDSMNANGKIISERDFVGWDFTAWVYDMFRPDESYAARGMHPEGNGINRIIKRSQLTKQEDDYLVKMGKLQYLNFLSPVMIGINRIKFSGNTDFNFAVRHYLTPFGYNINVDLFFNRNNKNWLLGLHRFHNKEKVFPGVELQRQELHLNIGQAKFVTDIRAMLWIQPKQESFYATTGKAGGLLQCKAFYKIAKNISSYVELEGKTRGWVAGDPFLKANINMSAGLFVDIDKVH